MYKIYLRKLVWNIEKSAFSTWLLDKNVSNRFFTWKIGCLTFCQSKHEQMFQVKSWLPKFLSSISWTDLVEMFTMTTMANKLVTMVTVTIHYPRFYLCNGSNGILRFGSEYQNLYCYSYAIVYNYKLFL